MNGITTISSKGQIVIPSAVRRHLDIKPQDKLRVSVSASKIIVEKDTAATELMGAFPSVRPVKASDIKAVVKEHVRKKLYTKS